MNEFQRHILLAAGGVVAGLTLLVASIKSIRYRITSRHLQVFCLGLPVRWFHLADIKRVHNRAVSWAERWPNVLFDSRRTLVVRRRRGLIRNILITPTYPFEFKATLEQARDAALRAGPKVGTAADPVRKPTLLTPGPPPADSKAA